MRDEVSWVDSMSAIYDQYLGPTLFAPWAVEVATVAAGLSPARVLELAAGTGILTSALLDAIPTAEIVATDLNPAMVAYAAARLPTIACSVADAQALDHPDSSFELVVCQFGAMFFPAKPTAYAEAARVLTPGGPSCSRCGTRCRPRP